MTNDRNMGNIGTANQSNLVSAHGIFNSIDYHRKMKPEYIATIHEELDERSESEYRVIEMQEMISHLDEELREIIILRYFQDLKFKEIAEIMGITVSKAKYLVGKAIGELQKEEPALESKRRGGKLNE